MRLTQGSHAGLFGDVLSYQAVEVFVGSSFPGMVGVGEVADDRELRFYQLVAMEFRAVVERYGLDSPAVPAQGLEASPVDLYNGFCPHFDYHNESGLALHQGHDAMVPVSANYRVAFPMADGFSAFGRSGPGRDVALFGQDPPVFVPCASFAMSFWLDPEVLVKASALLLVRKDVFVDRLMADGELPLPLDRGCYLLWT